MKDRKLDEKPTQREGSAEKSALTFKRAERFRITKKNEPLPGGLDWFLQLDDTLSSSPSSIAGGRATSNFTDRT